MLDWESRSRKKGRLICHSSGLMLVDAKFIVQPAGNKRVRAEKQKNVHAFIEGDWFELPKRSSVEMMGKVAYNPYSDTRFILSHDGQEVMEASEAHLMPREVEGVPRPRVFVPLD